MDAVIRNEEGSGWRAIDPLRIGLALLVAARLLVGASELGLATAAPEAALDSTREAAPKIGERAQEVARLLDGVARRQGELDVREREIEGRAGTLAQQEREVLAELARLEALEEKLGQRLSEASQAEDAAATSLAKVYGAMKPEEAAAILGELDDETLLRIVSRMRSKELGLILSRLDAKRAVLVTTRLASTG
jgi:flagellar motility protein MotE (MotC chaperone)